MEDSCPSVSLQLSGFSLRIVIYAQVLLTLVPPTAQAILHIRPRDAPKPARLEAVMPRSTWASNLTLFAILLGTLIQAVAYGLHPSDTVVVILQLWLTIMSGLLFGTLCSEEFAQAMNSKPKPLPFEELGAGLVFMLFFTMAGVVMAWAGVHGLQRPCAESTYIDLFGHAVPLSSTVVQDAVTAIGFLTAFPMINILMVMLAMFIVVAIMTVLAAIPWYFSRLNKDTLWNFAQFGAFLTVDVLGIVIIETTIRTNDLAPSTAGWSAIALVGFAALLVQAHEVSEHVCRMIRESKYRPPENTALEECGTQSVDEKLSQLIVDV